MQSNPEKKLEDFDELIVGDPVEIEKNLRNLLPEAKARNDKSIYLQIMSQIALAQAMQEKFDEAHNTLDEAEKLLSPEQHLARARILLERGRVYHQSDNLEAARPLFRKSFELSKQHNLDYHTINAAHMIAIVAETVEEKIQWNELAIKLTEETDDSRAKGWMGALYNNLGQNYLEAKQYENALEIFKRSKRSGEERGDDIIIRGAKWSIARSLRSLNRLDEALEIQLALLKEYEVVERNGELPVSMLTTFRGLVYEELTEIYIAKAKMFSALAHENLSKDPWFLKLELESLSLPTSVN